MEIQQALEIVSYKLGLKLGAKALEDSVLSPAIAEQAIADQAAGTPKAIDLRQYMQATKLVKEERLRLDKEAGEQFLAENAQNDGILSTASGLQYRIILLGSGRKPTTDDTVTVHYEGSLIDGGIFDSSLARGKAATFLVKKVIAGWQEGLQLMPVGSEFEFFIPQHLAYSDRGTETGVPPFATLLFKVTLIDIKITENQQLTNKANSD